MLWLENLGIPKNIFFSTTFYLITLSNIFLFLNLLNRFKKNHLLFYIFFSLNPALLLFSFYDLGGYARGESFGIFVCLLQFEHKAICGPENRFLHLLFRFWLG
jgi:hypothetical protein